MKVRIKQRWIKALLSGKFKQGRKRLYNKATDRYCCLGVLRTLLPPEMQHDADGFKDRNAILNNDQLRRVGLTHDKQEDLASFNDAGRSFGWIAAYIKKYL